MKTFDLDDFSAISYSELDHKNVGLGMLDTAKNQIDRGYYKAAKATICAAQDYLSGARTERQKEFDEAFERKTKAR